MKRPGGPSSSSDAKLTVGRKFAQQLEGLIANLNSTQPRYIRCVKPNQQKRPDLIAARLVEEQLTYSGVFEAVGPRCLPSESERTTNNAPRPVGGHHAERISVSLAARRVSRSLSHVGGRSGRQATALRPGGLRGVPVRPVAAHGAGQVAAQEVLLACASDSLLS